MVIHVLSLLRFDILCAAHSLGGAGECDTQIEGSSIYECRCNERL
jgi:hypothetical protein